MEPNAPNNFVRNIKLGLWLALFGCFTYVIGFWEIGGSSLGRHGADVWASPMVQRKLNAIRHDLQRKLDLANSPTKQPQKKRSPSTRHQRKQSEVSDNDRNELSELIANIGK